MLVIPRIDELDGNSNSVSLDRDAALDQGFDAQFAGDLR
jgi:hypothetical protein